MASKSLYAIIAGVGPGTGKLTSTPLEPRYLDLTTD